MAVGYAYSIIGDLDTAKDAAQEAFIEAIPLLDNVYSARAFPSWFRRIVFKHCDRQTRGRRPEHLDESTTGTDSDELARMASDELNESVWREIRKLPDQERIAITLHYMADLTHEQVARFLGATPATVNNRLRSARKQLRGRFEEMAKESLRSQAPSVDDNFANAVGICHAAQTGDVEQLRRILESAPDLINAEHPHIQGQARQTAIHFAAREGHLEAVQALLSAGAEPLRGFFNNYPVPCALTLARNAGHFEIVNAIETHIARSLDADADRLERTDDHGNTLLHLAVYHRHRPLVSDLLKRGASTEVRNKKGQKPIHLALYNGMGGSNIPMLRDAYPDVAALLIDHGAEVDLWTASALGDTADVRRLIQESPKSINAHNGAGRYPGGANYSLAIAAHGGHLDVVRLLLEHGADPDLENDNAYREGDQLESGVPLVFAIARGHFGIANLLIDRGARVDVSMIHSGPGIVDVALDCDNQDLIDRIVIKGGKPLVGHYVNTQNYLMIRELLDRCAMDQDGRWTVVGSLLLAGVRRPDPDVVEMCLEKNPKMVRGEGTWGRGSHCLIYYIMRSAYMQPSDEARDQVARILDRLMEHGLDVNDADKQKRTPLHTASNALRGHDPDEEELVTLVKRLVEQGGNLEAVDSELGTTPLGWAIRYGRNRLAAYFIEAGASRDPKGCGSGSSPRELAELYGDDEIRKLIGEVA
jgi:RNA polymerase sigma factor (sigma-70 family)